MTGRGYGVAVGQVTAALLWFALVVGCSGSDDNSRPEPTPASKQDAVTPHEQAVERPGRSDQAGLSEDEMEDLAAEYARKAIAEITAANVEQKLDELENDIEGELEDEITAAKRAGAN